MVFRLTGDDTQIYLTKGQAWPCHTGKDYEHGGTEYHDQIPRRDPPGALPAAERATAHAIGMQEGVPAYTTETEGMMLHDLTLALADMACRTGISWNTDPTPTFRDGDTEVSIVLERDQPNDHYSHLDAQQRIYGHTAVLSKCGIRIQGRARKLRINYRTTEQIRSAADSIFLGSGADVADSVFAAIRGMEDAYDGVPATLLDDLDGGESPTDDSRSLMSGPSPETRRFASQDG